MPKNNNITIPSVRDEDTTWAVNHTIIHGRLQYSNIIIDNTNPRMVVGVVVLLLIVLNLLGNTVVFYVYRFRVKSSVFSFYVTVLAALDVITALTSMLIDVIIKMRPLDENVLDLSSLCRISHFQVYSQSLLSGGVLTLIAYQRYRKVCHPLEPSMKLQTAKVVVAVMTLFCILLPVSMLFINGLRDVKVKVRNHVVNVTICRYGDDSEVNSYGYSHFQTIFPIILSSAFALVLCLVIGFYVMVARAVKKFVGRSSVMSKKSPTSPHTETINTERGFTLNNIKARREQYQLSRKSRTSVVSSGDGRERISNQMYRTFATITAIFVISYLPHLVVLILRKALDLDDKELTFTTRALLDLAYNCPYISTIANPIVYGFHNAEFRAQLEHMLTCRGSR